MTNQRREEYLQNGYVVHPGLLASAEVRMLLTEVESITADSTLAAHGTIPARNGAQPKAGRTARPQDLRALHSLPCFS